MAESDISSKLLNLNIGEDNNETERPKHFWNRALVAMKFNLEPAWLDATWNAERKPNFGMRNLNAVLEERCSLKLEIAGPLVDSYLKEIGRAFWAKMGRSKCTGLMPPVRMFIPYNLFRHICTLCVGYGAEMTCKETKRLQISLEINTLGTASKVFSPVRFEGDNYLRKRHFSKVKENDRNVLKFTGRASVVVGKNTPILFEYSNNLEKLTVTFYVQRYNKDGFAQNLQLQALCNSV